MKHKILYFCSIQELSIYAAQQIRKKAISHIKNKGYFTIAFSGGKTPGTLFQVLAQEPFLSTISWNQVYIFLVDERWVPLDHINSNYKLLNDLLLSKLSISKENIFFVDTNLSSIKKAEKKYEDKIKIFFQSKNNNNSFPVYDLILLGMGKDGHTASLFPNNKVLEEKHRWVRQIKAPALFPSVPRISLTLPVINNARKIMFLISGKNKLNLIKEIFKRNFNKDKKVPVSLVFSRNQILWLINKE